MRTLTASVARNGEGGLHFRYVLAGNLDALRIPPLRVSRQADELWKHTCFEAFIAGSPRGEEYRELNFSPSTEWAAYSFERYREGMAPIEVPSAPSITVSRSDSQLVVDARIEVPELLAEHWRAPGTALKIALTAVVEDDSGHLSYWSLKHAPGKPDFHHPAGFILEV